MSETCVFSYDKPLTADAKKTLRLLMERYQDDKGQPLVKFDSNPDSPDEGYVAIHVPHVIRPKYLTEEKAS